VVLVAKLLWQVMRVEVATTESFMLSYWCGALMVLLL